MKKRKGIILAGGLGTRLHPLTIGVSKQLLPIYDKPMIYYSLSVLMLAGIKEIIVITNPEYLSQFKRLLGNGSKWGLKFEFIAQPSPDGISQAYILAEDFLNGSPSALILGDNIFYGNSLIKILESANDRRQGGSVFAYQVSDPQNYGVVYFDDEGNAKKIVEKPDKPSSNYAVTGLYFLDEKASALAKSIQPSNRGELEIVDLLNLYLLEKSLSVQKMGRGYAWLDTGTYENLLDAGNFIKTLQKRTGIQIGSPEEISHQNRWIYL